MAISNELSSEIAAALFASKERSPRELKDLRDMLFKVHSTLEELRKKGHTHRLSSPADPVRPETAAKSAKG